MAIAQCNYYLDSNSSHNCQQQEFTTSFTTRATAQKQKDKAFREAGKFHDAHTSFLLPLKVGDLVTLQDLQTKLWEEVGVVTEIREDKLSYIVQVNNRLFVRSRKMLKRKDKEHNKGRVDIKEEDNSILQLQQLTHPTHIKPPLNSYNNGILVQQVRARNQG